MSLDEPLDYPFDEIVAHVEELRRTRPGIRCYQKYTCAGCGARLGIGEPFKFYTQGACDKCDAVTNIRQQGCNFLIVMEVVP